MRKQIEVVIIESKKLPGFNPELECLPILCKSKATYDNQETDTNILLLLDLKSMKFRGQSKLDRILDFPSHDLEHSEISLSSELIKKVSKN